MFGGPNKPIGGRFKGATGMDNAGINKALGLRIENAGGV